MKSTNKSINDLVTAYKTNYFFTSCKNVQNILTDKEKPFLNSEYLNSPYFSLYIYFSDEYNENKCFLTPLIKEHLLLDFLSKKCNEILIDSLSKFNIDKQLSILKRLLLFLELQLSKDDYTNEQLIRNKTIMFLEKIK